VSPRPRYEEPFAWWGPGWQAPAPRDIAELLRDETIDSWTAANLWAALARRRSLAVVAGASGVGKTTLLTALLDFLPPHTRRIYPRGCFETFAFMSDPTVSPPETVLLINEISPHLPVYLWGPAVGRIVEAAQRGFGLMATAHADSVHNFVGALTGSPLHVPAAQTAAFEFVVVLERRETNPNGRHVRGVWRLRPIRDGVAIAYMSPRVPTQHDISAQTQTHHVDPEPWFPRQELARRQRILENLRERRIAQLPIAGLFIETGARDPEP
jgi:energy-coupling factor transporter ATP-binding protein EcfA2